MNKNISFEVIENLRKVTGTLPSERPQKKTVLRPFEESLEVTIEDHSNNPYKAMFVAATSTWGDNKFEQKWPRTSNEGKLEVIKAVLTHNTLPQAKEMVNFVFRINGVPRWLFDYHTQVPFITIMSIGCRDNNKIDSDIVLTEGSEPVTAGIKAMYVNDVEVEHIFSKLKNLYEEVLDADQSSWQSARTFLPQSYLHAYHFSQNMLAIVGVKGFHASKQFGETEEEKALMYLYKRIHMKIESQFPLLGLYLNIMFLDKAGKENIFDTIRGLKESDLSVQDLKYFNQM